MTEHYFSVLWTYDLDMNVVYVISLNYFNRSRLLWEGTSRISALLSSSEQLQQSQSGWVPLVISLMYEYHNRKDSEWKPYLNFLPTVQQLDQPMFWSNDKLSLLDGRIYV